MIKVTDAFEPGDSFSVFLDGGLTPVLSTPSVAASTTPNISDPDVAYSSPLFSHGSFDVGPGSHVLTLFDKESPFGSGGAFIRADAPSTPEPSTIAPFAFLGLGLGGMFLRARKRRAA